MAEYSFKYGDISFKEYINDNDIANVLLPKEIPAFKDLKEEVFKALDNPTDTPALKNIVKKGENVLIIVSDVTRLWIKTKDFIVHIINYLNSNGIDDANISILVALGSHRASTEKEKELIVGEEIYKRIKIYNHDAFDKTKLSYVGESSSGTPIYINDRVVKADRVILTGGIVFHLFAGFGGGAKSIVPGAAGIDTIQHNHRLTFYKGESTGLNPNARSNKIHGNPMREDITEICRKIAPDFLFNVVQDGDGNFVEFAAGDFEEAWLKGCSTVANMYGIAVGEKADIIVASAGGYPKDINLYQAVKTMDNCLYGGKEDSVIVLLAECREGLGAEEFLEWFKYDTLEALEAALKKNFTVPGYAAYKTAFTARFRKFILVSSLERETVEKLGFIHCTSLKEALKLAYKISIQNPKVSLMPYGGSTLPII